VLLSGNVLSKHVAAGNMIQTMNYQNINHLSLCSPVLLSANLQYEHVATGESVQTTILSEH